MKNPNLLNPIESLNLISNTINKTKEDIKEQSFYFLVWGWQVTIASFTHYLLLSYTDFLHSYLTWIIIIPIGWILTIIYSKKQIANMKYETFLERFLKYLWIVIGISFINIIFICSFLKVIPTSLILLLAGIGTLITGLTMKFKSLTIGGIMFFAFSIVSLFVSNTKTLLINGVATIVGYLIPAYLLCRPTQSEGG